MQEMTMRVQRRDDDAAEREQFRRRWKRRSLLCLGASGALFIAYASCNSMVDWDPVEGPGRLLRDAFDNAVTVVLFALFWSVMRIETTLNMFEKPQEIMGKLLKADAFIASFFLYVVGLVWLALSILDLVR